MRPILCTLACLFSCASGPLAAQPSERKDLYGDPLPEGAIARLGTIRLRPGASIKFLAFSPDSKQLACWAGGHGNANALAIYDVQSGKELRWVETLDARAYAFAWLADGRGLALVELKPEEGKLYMWEFTDPKAVLPRVQGELRGAYQYNYYASHAISPDGRWIAACRRNSGQAKPVEIRRWQSGKLLDDQKPAFTWAPPGQVCLKLLFAPDSRELLGFFWKDQVIELRAFDVDKGQARVVLNIPTGKKSSEPWLGANVALAPDGKMLAARIGDLPLRLFELSSGQEQKAPKIAQAKNVENSAFHSAALCYGANHRFLAFADNAGTLRFWDSVKDKTLWEVANHPQQVETLAIAPDGHYLAAGGRDSAIRIWQTATGQELYQRTGPELWPWHVEVAEDGRTGATVNDDGKVRLWDIRTGRFLKETSFPGKFHDLQFVPGKEALVVYSDQLFHHWHFADHQFKPLFGVKGNPYIAKFRFSPDAEDLVTAGANQIAVWDWRRGNLRRAWKLDDPKRPGVDYSLRSLAVTKNGQVITYCSLLVGGNTYLGESIDIWDAKIGAFRRNVKAGEDGTFGHGMAMSPDQQTLAIVGMEIRAANMNYDALQVFDLRTGKVRPNFSATRGSGGFSNYQVYVTAFSPDSRLLASAEGDDKVVVFEVATGLIRRVLRGHRNIVFRLAFTPDGRRLVTSSADLTGLVWDLSLASQAKSPATAKELHQAWDELSNRKDGTAVHHTMVTLSSAPKEAATLIGQYLRPAVVPDAKHVARLVADLDSVDFGVRTKAYTELDRLGEDAVSALREHLKKPQPLEVTRRLERLLDKHDPPDLSEQRLRAIRALEILEDLATPEARKLLAALAKGAPTSPRTLDAAAALRRVKISNPEPGP